MPRLWYLLVHSLLNAVLTRLGPRRLYYDALTGLTNGEYHREYWLPRAHAYATRTGIGIAQIFGDGNGVKLVNDRFGHAEGDRILQHNGLSLDELVYHACPANHGIDPSHCCHDPRHQSNGQAYACPEDALRANCRKRHRRAKAYPCHNVARSSGDEYLLGFIVETKEDAKRIADGIAAAMSNMTHVIGSDTEGAAESARHHVTISMSIGVAYTHDPRANLSLLLRRADEAMYRAKKHKKTVDPTFGAAIMYDDSFDKEQERRSLEQAMWLEASKDPGRREWRVQPVVNGQRQITAYYARTLPRELWRDGQPAAPPGRDISHYEGIVVQLIDEILTFFESTGWPHWQMPAGDHVPYLHISIHARLLREDGFTRLLGVLREHSRSAMQLVLRVNGLTQQDDMPLVHERLGILQGMISNIALDNFGGAAGAAQIPPLVIFRQPGQVVLDAAFVSQAASGSRTQAVKLLLHDVVAMCEHQSKNVIITGIDTPEQEEVFEEISQSLLLEAAFRNDIGMTGHRMDDAVLWRKRRYYSGGRFGSYMDKDEFSAFVKQLQA